MAVFPQMNLPPEATPWGRQVQQQIEAQQREIERLRQDLANLQRTVDTVLARVTQL